MRYIIDLQKFCHDPYPDLVAIQHMAPVVHVQQLDAALITRRADIFTQEKRIDLFSSHQADGLTTQLMGKNMI